MNQIPQWRRLSLMMARGKRLEDSIELMQQAVMLGLRDPKTRELVACVTAGCKARDDTCEVAACFEFLKQNVKYMADPINIDQFQTLERTLQFGIGDCLPIEALVLTRSGQFKRFGDLEVGDVIAGDGVWTKITAVQYKGMRSTLDFELNNGGLFSCTGGHRLFRVPRAGKKPGLRGDAEEVRASRLAVGNDLLTADKLPEGTEDIPWAQAEDASWLLGTYIADGSPYCLRASGRATGVLIAGSDGKPKEAQKDRVRQICERKGWRTETRHDFIRIYGDEAWAFFSPAGHHTFEKHVPTLSTTAKTARALLEGIAADASISREGRKVVYATSSPLLPLQIRVLHRLLGESVHIRWNDRPNKWPTISPHCKILRRNPEATTQLRPHARIVSISQGRRRPVADITTDTGKFYLPESDLIVHNCDDMSIAACTMLAEIGYETKFRVIQSQGSDTYNHVFSLVILPKRAPTAPVPLDLTLHNAAVGLQPPPAFVTKYRDFPAVL